MQAVDAERRPLVLVNGFATQLSVKQRDGRKMYVVKIDNDTDLWFERARVNEAVVLFCQKCMENRHEPVRIYNQGQDKVVSTIDVQQMWSTIDQEGPSIFLPNLKSLAEQQHVLKTLHMALAVVDAAMA
eukprot:5288172-Prymnesium_polylepis.1